MEDLDHGSPSGNEAVFIKDCWYFYSFLELGTLMLGYLDSNFCGVFNFKVLGEQIEMGRGCWRRFG